jgi:ABC-type glycerol-3-phosphate transport system substrate-binding protein
MTYREMMKANPKIIVFNCNYVGSDHGISDFKEAFEGREIEYYSIPSWEKDKGPWCTVAFSLGVNKKSSYKDAASDFIKFTLRSDMQTMLTNTLSSIPVNKKAREAQKSRCLTDSPILNGKYPLLPQDTEIIDRFINKCNEIATYDTIITKIVRDEVTSLISGDKTPEQTAKSIQDKVNTYLKQ